MKGENKRRRLGGGEIWKNNEISVVDNEISKHD